MNMSDPLIACPKCGTQIKLTESLAAPMIQAARLEDQEKLRAKEQAIATKEATFQRQSLELKAQKNNMEAQISKRLEGEQKRIAQDEKLRAQKAAQADIDARDRNMRDLQNQLNTQATKLETAQKAELAARQKERELTERERELELNVEKKVQENLAQVQAKARAEAEAKLGLKVTEKDDRIASMSRTIEDLQRKAAQGSQQSQGEALEVTLETQLSQKFPYDRIEPVKKGEFGGDALQIVLANNGKKCGSILWETKHTKAWSNDWLAKLRNDQRNAKADIAVIVSTTLPKGVKSFEQIDNVWVVGVSYFEALASVLRQGLINIQSVKLTQVGQQTKTELVYAYLTGSEFRQRVEAIVENFTAMRVDLDRERKALTKLWSKREKQIQNVLDSTVGLHGDLQGIAGHAIQEIEGLEFDLPLLEEES